MDDTSVIEKAEVRKDPLVIVKGKAPPIYSDSLWNLIQDSLPPLNEAFRPKEYYISLEELKELDYLLRPNLLAWCRLVFPMGYRSLKGDYWVVPQGMVKIHLLSGATWHLGEKRDYKRRPKLLLRGITPLHWWMGHTHETYAPAARSLREWCLAQQNAPLVEEPPFHKPTEEVVQLFYYVMFSGFMLGSVMIPDTKTTYRGTARDLWKIFKEFYGPERTKREPDFNSHHRMKKFLHWCLENDPIHFMVIHKIDRTKKEVWEMRDNWSSSSPVMRKKLEGKIPPAGIMSESKLSDEELWEGILEDLAWESSPEDLKYNLENAERMKRFRETNQQDWDNIRVGLPFLNEWRRKIGLEAYIKACRSGKAWEMFQENVT
jgi:hypothetical protein